MPLGGILLIPGESGWQLGTDTLRALDLPADASPEAAATQIASALQSSGYQGEDVVLAIPGTWCLTASFALAKNKARRRDTLALQLEEQLPIPAEEFVADFVHTGEWTLGIAGRLAVLSPIIEALESHQVHVAHIVPLALLGLQGLGDEVAQANACILWQYGDRVDVIRLDDGRLIGWSAVPADARTVAAEVARFSFDVPVSSVWCHLDAALVQSLQAQGWSLTSSDRDQLSAALDATGRIASGADHPLVDLRHGALGAADPLRQLRGSLNIALLAAIIFLCVAGIAMLLRSSRYQQVVADSEARQAAAFQQAYPNTAVPVNIKARLEAEYRSLGSAGLQVDANSAPAIAILRDLLGHLPPSTKIDLSRVVINGNRFRLEGYAAGADQANAISSAITTATSVKLEPIALQPMPNGAYGFVIQSAVPARSTAPAAPEAP